MAIQFELNEITDREIKLKIERTICDSIGDRANGEAWKVWIRGAGNLCEVTVEGPAQTRKRFFFDDGQPLEGKVSDWLRMYPF